MRNGKCAVRWCDLDAMPTVGAHSDSDRCESHTKFAEPYLSDEVQRLQARVERRERKVARLTADDYSDRKMQTNNRKLAERSA